MNFRQARTSDMETLHDLVAMMLTNDHAMEIAKEIVAEFFNESKLVTNVVELEGQVVGYSVGKLNGFEGTDGLIEITFLGVFDTYRKQGLARGLVKFLENQVKEKGIRKAYAKVNPDNHQAVCFWIKQGYEFEARLKDFDYPSHDSYFMGKTL